MRIHRHPSAPATFSIVQSPSEMISRSRSREMRDVTFDRERKRPSRILWVGDRVSAPDRIRSTRIVSRTTRFQFCGSCFQFPNPRAVHAERRRGRRVSPSNEAHRWRSRRSKQRNAETRSIERLTDGAGHGTRDETNARRWRNEQRVRSPRASPSNLHAGGVNSWRESSRTASPEHGRLEPAVGLGESGSACRARAHLDQPVQRQAASSVLASPNVSCRLS